MSDLRNDLLRVEAYDYHLPEELIAQEPAEPRDASRLMVLHRDSERIEHRRFRDVVEYLTPQDVLVLNDTRVLPARLLGRKETGGAAEVLLLRRLPDGDWEALVRPGRRLRPGTVVLFDDPGLRVRIGEEEAEGTRRVRLLCDEPEEVVLQRVGRLPLPPYITRTPDDPERYQTVFAVQPGSAAAPTAGLHFTKELLEAVAARGTRVVYVTLHVGLDTFRPVTAERVTDHRIHREYCSVSAEAAAAINAARRAGGRCIAVGTTTCRTLESAADEAGAVQPFAGETQLFIYPGYRFRVVDALITNFHLPRSSLLMLVAAFAGKERIDAAYREAIARRYRFFSFGDAMLLL